MKKRILVISSANMDMAMTVRRLPSAGETLIDGGSYAFLPGGKGANSAIAFSRLGGDCVFCTKLGRDAHGDTLLDFYNKNSLDTRFVSRSQKYPTGLAVIMVESSGMNRIVVYPGANRAIGKNEVDEAFLCYPDAIYLNFEIPYDTVLTACEYAVLQNIPIFIDAGPASDAIPLEKLPEIEVFSPNESETYRFTGIMPDNLGNCLRAASALYERMKVKYIVIKLGGRGCFVYDGTYQNLCAPYETSVIDTTAAGDAFTAALTLEYMRGADILAACRYANAVGAMVVSKKGASSSVPTEEEVEKFIKEYGKND